MKSRDLSIPTKILLVGDLDKRQAFIQKIETCYRETGSSLVFKQNDQICVGDSSSSYEIWHLMAYETVNVAKLNKLFQHNITVWEAATKYGIIKIQDFQILIYMDADPKVKQEYEKLRNHDTSIATDSSFTALPPRKILEEISHCLSLPKLFKKMDISVEKARLIMWAHKYDPSSTLHLLAGDILLKIAQQFIEPIKQYCNGHVFFKLPSQQECEQLLSDKALTTTLG
jgi:hypothetical protein